MIIIQNLIKTLYSLSLINLSKDDKLKRIFTDTFLMYCNLYLTVLKGPSFLIEKDYNLDSENKFLYSENVILFNQFNLDSFFIIFLSLLIEYMNLIDNSSINKTILNKKYLIEVKFNYKKDDEDESLFRTGKFYISRDFIRYDFMDIYNKLYFINNFSKSGIVYLSIFIIDNDKGKNTI